MKKIRIFIILFILSFSFSVKADVFFEIDCNKKDIATDSSVTCEGILLYERVSINDIEMEYETNLNLDFIASDGFNITKNGNKINIHTDKPLYDKILNCTKIMDIIVSGNKSLQEQETLVLKNIRINKSDIEMVDDYEETFNILMEEEKLDDNCDLDGISVEGIPIKDFDKSKTIYKNILVDREIIFVDAIRSSNKSMVTGLGNAKVPKGETIVREVSVTAENGDNKIYYLHITNTEPKVIVNNTSKKEEKSEIKEEVKEEVNEDTKEAKTKEKVIAQDKVKSSDNTLRILELFYKTERIDFDFLNNKYEYDIKVDSNVDKISIISMLNDPKASYIMEYGPRDISLKYGNNKVLIKTKAEDNTERVYTLNITRLDDRNSDNSLFFLQINDSIISLIDNKYSYETRVPYNDTKTIVKAMTNSNKAKIEYKDIDLKVGNNKLLIKVIPENGKKQYYNINIIREEEILLPAAKDETLENSDLVNINENNSKDEKPSNIIFYIAVGVGVVIFVFIYFIKKKKS